jgi:hypothetical protein
MLYRSEQSAPNPRNRSPDSEARQRYGLGHLHQRPLPNADSVTRVAKHAERAAGTVSLSVRAALGW